MVSGLVLSVMLVAFAAPAEAPQMVADAGASVAPVRVYVGGVDTSRFEQLFYPALAAGRFGNASQLTGVGRTIVRDAAGDINVFEDAWRRHFEQSAAFELVTSLEAADVVLVVEADSISSDFRRRLRGVVKLVDVNSGETTYRRRVNFNSISQLAEINRELNTNLNLMEEWAAAVVR